MMPVTMDWKRWSIATIDCRKMMTGLKPMDYLTLAQEFADALDGEDYSAAAKFLRDGCEYECRGKCVVGVQAIVDSYRENAEWARETFDRIVYSSHTKPLPDDRVLITFIDEIGLEDKSHTYRCQQILSFDRQGLIRHIQHQEIGKEQTALKAFLRQSGIERLGDG